METLEIDLEAVGMASFAALVDELDPNKNPARRTSRARRFNAAELRAAIAHPSRRQAVSVEDYEAFVIDVFEIFRKHASNARAERIANGDEGVPLGKEWP
jgi:hypothetical protein